MALVRLRDRTAYRQEFDHKYPEKAGVSSVQVSGSYSHEISKHTIDLISDEGNYFISFNDGDWQWMDQLKPIGPNKFKLVSFTHVVEINEHQVIYSRGEGSLNEIYKMDAR